MVTRDFYETANAVGEDGSLPTSEDGKRLFRDSPPTSFLRALLILTEIVGVISIVVDIVCTPDCHFESSGSGETTNAFGASPKD